MPNKELNERPQKVFLATLLFYSVVGIGIVRTAMTALRHIEVRSPQLLIVTKSIIFTISVILIYQLGKGRNWAKWSLVIILAMSFPLAVVPAFEALSHNTLNSLLGFLQIGLYVAGLAFLFQKSSAAWFRSVKE